MKYIAAIAFIVLISACNGNDTPDHDQSIEPAYVGLPAPKDITYNIIAQHPHDTSAYTQGLQVYNGKLYEGTGDYETSSLRITDWKTGAVEKKTHDGNQKDIW